MSQNAALQPDLGADSLEFISPSPCFTSFAHTSICGVNFINLADSPSLHTASHIGGGQ